MGFVSRQLPPGRYQIRVDHAEASATYEIDVGDKPVAREFELPRRSSATLLSSTVDKHEWLTDPVVAASKWDAPRGEGQAVQGEGQAAFISLRPRQLGGTSGIVGRLYLEGRSGRRDIYEAGQPGNGLRRTLARGSRAEFAAFPDAWNVGTTLR